MHEVRNCGPQNACTPEMLFDYWRTLDLPAVGVVLALKYPVSLLGAIGPGEMC